MLHGLAFMIVFQARFRELIDLSADFWGLNAEYYRPPGLFVSAHLPSIIRAHTIPIDLRPRSRLRSSHDMGILINPPNRCSPPADSRCSRSSGVHLSHV